VFCWLELKTRIFSTLLLIAVAAPPLATADEWTSDKFLCALTIPTQESWTKGPQQDLPTGEVVFHGVSMQRNEGIVVTFVPEMPSTNLRDPEIERRIQELLILQGWTLESGIEVTWQGRQFLQFISRRRDAISGPMVAVSRATIRAGDLFVITAYGRGEPNRAEDPKFLRIMNTFRFLDRPQRVIEQSTGAELLKYKIALFGSASAAALLMAAFAVTIFRSRHGFEGH
jgi:hypothetical protein